MGIIWYRSLAGALIRQGCIVMEFLILWLVVNNWLGPIFNGIGDKVRSSFIVMRIRSTPFLLNLHMEMRHRQILRQMDTYIKGEMSSIRDRLINYIRKGVIIISMIKEMDG